MASHSSKRKTIIYQLFPRLLMPQRREQKTGGTIDENGCGKLGDITPTVLRRIRRLGASHVWFTGIIRHATATDYSAYGIPKQDPHIVKGKAGSPYAIADYYDVDPDLATNVDLRMKEWQSLVARTHKAGLKIVIDFVPNHVARQYRSIAAPKGVCNLGENDDTTCAFAPDNNFYYLPHQCFAPDFPIGTYHEEPARATGNDQFHAHPTMNDWYDTVKLNYGCPPLCTQLAPVGADGAVPATWTAMLYILRFWAQQGVDAFRCDMVHMVPLAFWQWVIPLMHKEFPHVDFIAEVYDEGMYRPLLQAGFSMLYDKVGLYDTLIAICRQQWSTHDITRCWQRTDDIAEHMLAFIENHDEQRVASKQLLDSAEAALPAMLVALCLRNSPAMIYAGQEVGEQGDEKEGYSQGDGRTTIYDYWCVESLQRTFFQRRKLTRKQRRLEQCYQQMLNLVNTQPALSEGRMFDLKYVNPHINRQFAFFRQHGSQLLLCIANFNVQPATISLHIPNHAIEWLGIKEHIYQAHDLLNDTDTPITLHIQADKAIEISTIAYGTHVFQLMTDGE